MSDQRTAFSDLRQYCRGMLYNDTIPAQSFQLPVVSNVPPYDDRDIYDTHLGGADRREVAAAEHDKPVADYEPPIWFIRDPVTGDALPALGIGRRTNNPTYVMALGGADANRYILERQAPTRNYDRTVPREIVRGVACQLCPDDQQSLRAMARLGQMDVALTRSNQPKTPRVTIPSSERNLNVARVTIKSLARELNVTRVTIHRRHHDAVKALLAALYSWHESNPEREVA